MPSFTDEEIQTVVEKLVRSTIRRPYDTLGVRRTDVTFNDVQEAAAGVFLLYQRTPFYLAFLATQRLKESIQEVASTVGALLEALRVLRKRVLPVRDLSSLANAKAALVELETVVGGSKPPKDLSKVPSFVRFNANVDRFLSKVGPNIKDSTGIVPTPNEARSKIPGLVERLKGQVAEIKRKAGLIARSLEDYGSLGLPQLLSKGIVQRARQVLSARAAQLEAMSEPERLVVLRETILELIGAKAVVKKFGAFTSPTSAFSLTGALVPFADKERPATEAVVVSDLFGPFVLVPGTDPATSTNVLSLWVDGAPSHPSPPTVQFFLPSSLHPKIEGLQSEPFNIITGVNNNLQLLVNGTLTVNVPLTAGSARTAAQVAADLTAALTAYGFKGEAYFSPLMFDGEVQVLAGNQLKLAFGRFPPNSINVGDEVDFYYGANVGQTRAVANVLPSPADPQTIVLVGAALTTGTARIQYGSPQRKVRIVPTDRKRAVENRETIQLKMPDTLRRDSGITLGMFGELYGKGEPTDAQVVADFITQNSTRVRAEVDFRPTWSDINLRTEPSDAFTVVAYYYRGEASWTGGSPVTVTFPADAPLTFSMGDVIVFRGGNDPDELGQILSISSNTATVLPNNPLTASAGIVEVGPSASLPIGASIVVPGGVNDGRYLIDALHPTIPFQFKLKTLMPQYRDGFNQPVMMVGSVGVDGVKFFSHTRGLAGTIEIYDPLGVFMASPGPHAADARTHYVLLPSKPNDLEEGDFLEFYESNPETPNYERVVEQVYSDPVVRLDGTVSAKLLWMFGTTAVPFVVLRTDKVVAFEAFRDLLLDWGKQKDLGDSYFTDLARFIQPLLANDNPTDSQVRAAEQRVRDLFKLFDEATAVEEGAPATSLEWILSGYKAPHVPEADALIRAFKEKGADRAVDLLLECQFSAFFGLTQDDTSYAGHFQKALREVARLDMPVRKNNRLIARSPKVIAQIETPNFEFDDSDLDPTPLMDPPVEV